MSKKITKEFMQLLIFFSNPNIQLDHYALLNTISEEMICLIKITDNKSLNCILGAKR